MTRFRAMMNRLRNLESAGRAPAATDPARSDTRGDDGDQRREHRGKRRR
jgi:hypothetical protein